MNLEALVDLERFTGLTTAEIEAAKTDFHMSTCRDPIWQCPDCASKLKAHRLVIAAVSSILREDERSELSAAGRLLPEGAEQRESVFELLWYNQAGQPVHWGAETLEEARALPGQMPHGVRGEIREQKLWVGPWSVVEPVAVQGGTDG